ncbi:SDR family oxidoreductase [Pseudomonas nitroreducens]|uniref:SDR family oxidoreductase n=1 Tax=Pseudomonas nitroreducens TaxID=46680 RepID=A0A6G6J3L1_PSENT|nr:SDR family oxidoreductase [Pseudomonas nitroreducens]QIE89773.1 SDR family oxidoreductase [Pseudomonas nitroreducens]
MKLGIEGRVALVSGGSKGIGRACSEMLAAEGCRVMVVARGAAAIEEAVEGIRAQGGIAQGVSADLTSEDGVRRAVAATCSAFAAPDIVISNVHGGEPGDFLEEGAERFLESFQGLVMSVVHLARATLPHMREQRWGRLLTVGTAAAKEPAPGLRLMAANTARAGVVTLNKSLADEFAAFGITVNTLATGWIATEHMREQVGMMAAARAMPLDDLLQRLSRSVPVQRMGRPEEIASLAVYLCSELGGYLTGCLIPVDGGAHRAAW